MQTAKLVIDQSTINNETEVRVYQNEEDREFGIIWARNVGKTFYEAFHKCLDDIKNDYDTYQEQMFEDEIFMLECGY